MDVSHYQRLIQYHPGFMNFPCLTSVDRAQPTSKAHSSAGFSSMDVTSITGPAPLSSTSGGGGGGGAGTWFQVASYTAGQPLVIKRGNWKSTGNGGFNIGKSPVYKSCILQQAMVDYSESPWFFPYGDSFGESQ